MTIMVVFGTRPEAIKMCPLAVELKRRHGVKTLVCVTGQHRELLDSVLEIFGVVPDYDLAVMREGQSLFDVTTAVLRGMERVLAEAKPDSALAKAVSGKLDDIEARTVIDLAKAGDPDCVAIFDNYCYHLTVGLINIINLYDPEIIALGGGVSNAGAFLLDKVNALLPEMVFFKTMPRARIELAKLGNDAGIIGAAMLGRQEG